MARAPLPPQRAASLLLAVGALNLVITLFVALVAARSWNRIPELAVTARVLDANGAELGRHDFRGPVELDDVTETGARSSTRLADGSQVEVAVARGHFEAHATNGNLLRVLQLAIPLAVSALFLAAGLRLRRIARS
ncbi:MAG: hypothetical protein FJ294_07910 [Planctomycetes bacterium]|nr:hypothetical protein [Planctomycetota bacterium]